MYLLRWGGSQWRVRVTVAAGGDLHAILPCGASVLCQAMRGAVWEPLGDPQEITEAAVILGGGQ